jgi:RHS repeat-associated protein
MSFVKHFIIIVLLQLCLPSTTLAQLPLISTESDPDAFIHNCVNVINGDYCESVTDLVVQGPDNLTLRRFYRTKDPVTGIDEGGWYIFPERFLVIGKNPSERSGENKRERSVSTLAFVGKRSGGILPYHGFRDSKDVTKDPLKVDTVNMGLGMVNTYAGVMDGQTNHRNNCLNCFEKTCELTLGDGTKRIYKPATIVPSRFMGEEFISHMASQVLEPSFFLLEQEILPSGNQLFFTYDEENHLIKIKMKNPSLDKTLSWISFSYHVRESECQIHAKTSDNRKINYHFILSKNNRDQLMKVSGSHSYSVYYQYKDALVKKVLPEGRFLEIDYENDKVVALRMPNAQSGLSEVFFSFSYETGHTDVLNGLGLKTRYVFDQHFRLTAVERYDDQDNLYRIEKKIWGKTHLDTGWLLAKTIENGSGRLFSFRRFQYDSSGNIVAERLYGNLTGNLEAVFEISPDGQLMKEDQVECHVKTYCYSNDGLNLLTKVGDAKGNQTVYSYQPGTNLLIKKFIYDHGKIRRRTFQFYNGDGVCIKEIEDDGSSENEAEIYGYNVTERHIKEIKPKMSLPGVGLPEGIEERVLDLKARREILVKRLDNTFDDQSHQLTTTTYDSNNQYAFMEQRSYDSVGHLLTESDVVGNVAVYTYDGLGNQTSLTIENTVIETDYDFNNQPIQVVKTNQEGQSISKNCYDVLGRKTCSTDRFGNTTYYEYDPFDRVTKITFPEVLDENRQVIRPSFQYTYDIFGNVLTIQDAKGFMIKRAYNLRGDPTQIQYPDGSSEQFFYDREGSLYRALNRQHIITEFTYDFLGRGVDEKSFTTNKKGDSYDLTHVKKEYKGFRCVSETKNKRVKRYLYDPAGRVRALIEHAQGQDQTNPASRLTEFAYNSLGQCHQKKVWFDNEPSDYSVECFEYDLMGNVVEKKIKDAQGTCLIKKGYAYNSQGKCEEEYIIENGSKSSLLKTIYNSEMEAVGYTDGVGRQTKIIIDYTYKNHLGQTVVKKTIVNPLGMQTEIEFDALGRVAAISKKDPLGLPLSSQSTLYDALGNPACEIHDQIVDGEKLDFQKIKRHHGPMGLLEEEIEAAHSSSEKHTQYRYNSKGQLTRKVISGIETPIKYTYSHGRLSKIEVKEPDKEPQLSNRYSYDVGGNIETASSLHGKSVHRTYDIFGQVIRESIHDGLGSFAISRYAYDRIGRMKEITLPDASKIVYTYDAYFCRSVKRISPQGEILYTHEYTDYDKQGHLLCERHIGSVGASQHTYDLNGQKTSVKNNFLNEQYDRDVLGRINQVKGLSPIGYEYNALSQLTVERKKIEKRYAYDSLDNRIKDDNNPLVYNALNQLIGSSRAEYSYDPNGNLLRKLFDGETTQYEHDILSQLISLKHSDQMECQFSYDPFGRLLYTQEIDNNQNILSTTRYFYIGYQEIGSLSANNDIESLKIPGMQGGHIAQTSIAFELNGKPYVPLHDIRGNVVQLIDPHERTSVERYEYEAFGNETIYNADGERVSNSKIDNPWRFFEKRTFSKPVLIWFGLRFYDPEMGRWISQDPLGMIDGPNQYAYVRNNPLRYLDRFGLSSENISWDKIPENTIFLKPAPDKQNPFFREREQHCPKCSASGGDIGKTLSSHLPTIKYCDGFEKMYPDYEPSRLFDVGLQETENLAIGFINGVWNDFNNAYDNAQYLSELAGGYKIHAVYNATHGKSADLVECRMGLSHVATEPVRLLHRMWNSHFEKSSIDAKFLMVCHSQGAIHVRNALLDYPTELRERIIPVAVCPAAYIYRKTCAQVTHYRNASARRDFIPRLDKSGAKREIETIINLDSHPEAAFFDHEFQSLTYRRALRDELIIHLGVD